MNSEKPTLQLKSMNHIIEYEWKAEKLIKKLKFHQDKCNGCGLCIKVCPVNAIMLGPIKEVASGEMEAPLIIIDETKCIACPLCSAICPLNALTLEFENKPKYAKVKGTLEIDSDKCIPCLLCEKICPRNAIKSKIRMPKKEELVIYEKDEIWAKGEITIDEEKCDYCGLCELLCDAIRIVWTDPKPPQFKLGLGILIDEEKCDYCGLCEKICPVEAIKVRCEASAPRKIFEPKIEGEISIDEENCIYCKLCEDKCPVQAIRVEKAFKGEIILENLDKCDPSGCKNCVNICPANSIYVPRREKGIKISEKSCIYCGACQEVCPENVIKINILEVKISSSNNLWSKSLIEHLQKIVKGYTPPKLEVYVREVRPPPREIQVPPPMPVPPKPKEFEVATKIIDELIANLKYRRIRALIELGKTEKLKEILI